MTNVAWIMHSRDKGQGKRGGARHAWVECEREGGGGAPYLAYLLTNVYIRCDGTGTSLDVGVYHARET